MAVTIDLNHMNQFRRLLTVLKSALPVLAMSLAIASVGSGQPPAEPSEPASLDQISVWIAGLSDGEYATRDQAMRSLIEVGPAAIEPVEQALAGSGLELTTRAIFILQEVAKQGLAKQGDSSTEDAARRILTALAEQRTTVAARRASESLAILNVLQQQKSLKELELLGARVDPAYAEPGVLPQGMTVFLVEIGATWKGTEKDLGLLQWLSDVEQVTLAGPQVTDDWIPHLRGMQRLLILKISGARISDAGLIGLQNLPAQRILLQYVPVGDIGAANLAKARNVRSVRAYGTRITEVGDAAMMEANILVDRRKGAFLGITVPPNRFEQDWSVQSVTEGSAADKAGLQVGDKIVEYGGKPVDTFKSLITMIAQNDVGDTVELIVRRKGEKLEKTITFGGWN